MSEPQVQLPVSGLQAALIVGAACAYIAYPFRNESDARRRRERDLDEVDGLSSLLGGQWRITLANAGLATREAWAAKSHVARGVLRCEFVLSRAQLQLLAELVSACVREFEDDWLEFTIVAPGGIQRYPATHADLVELERVLKGALKHP
jgi:hypothetical protein